MPYILPADRERLKKLGEYPKTVGEVNYLVSIRIAQEVAQKGKSYSLFNDIVIDLDDAAESLVQGVRLTKRVGEFADIAWMFIFETAQSDIDIAASVDNADFERLARRTNSARGAIECAKLEFVRRVVAPYEDEKKTQNGDVYD